MVEDFSENIGEKLRVARENAGWSFEDITFRTRIPTSVVRALESGDFAVFSSPTYAKSFLTQYSELLGVDARVWLDALEPETYATGEVVRPLWEAAGASTPSQRLVKQEALPPERQLPNGWIAAASIIAATALLLYMGMRTYEFFEARFDIEPAPPAAEAPKPVAPPARAEAPRALAARPEIAQPAAAKPTLPPSAEDDSPPPRAIIVR
jgi:cytoskeletal protein RodZ